ncbi:MAG: serine--tRNA ligase [Candidatus Levybacteria bacterium CG10_big_fil_rev_8_21_14_0_10_35_13]|nr:MAG: serine--tRNA ligase [Candidatus Levybacteria bacterium CG10_big_fil_rev_8_21_14_0_10_35_13]
MLDIKYIRENPSKTAKAAKDKGINVDIDHIIKIDAKYRELSLIVQNLREERNRAAKSQNIEEGRKLKIELEREENALKAVEEELREGLLKVPNPAKDDVKVGRDERDNEVLRKVGKPARFSFTPKDHLGLGEKLNIIDVVRASKISGSRFYFLKNEGALLEFALRQLAFDILLKEGFIPLVPPVLIKTEIMRGLGYMENGGDEDMYILDKDDLVLVGTSEQSIVAMHKDEILQSRILPLRYVGFSSCFRREAGSYGKDTRGILRAHQFDKVEMVSFTAQGEDDKEHEYLLTIEEKLLQALEIPYQVVKMCTGDLGFPAARKYDLEAWIPSENKYREVTSTSTTTDFQARRLNIKYQEGNDKKYVNILNGTAFSTRPIIAILENYQQKDGSVRVPEVLQKYIGKKVINSKK